MPAVFTTKFVFGQGNHHRIRDVPWWLLLHQGRQQGGRCEYARDIMLSWHLLPCRSFFASTVPSWQCPSGEYCDSTNVGRSTGPCKAGFYCPEGSTSPWGELCTQGTICLEGSGSPGRCPVGYSTLADGASECVECPAGTMCNGTLPEPCKEGFYCEGNTNAKACPAGTYMPFKGATSEESCLSCPGGYACPKSGTVTPSVCEAGYFCVSRSTATTPSALDTSSEMLRTAARTDSFPTEGGGPCEQGTFCPQSTRFGIPCPPGMFCGRSMLQEPQGLCAAGHFCGSAAVTDSPQGNADVCPSKSLGGYCPAGKEGTGVGKV
ncbi:hypothetical protein Emed_006359 [Eimeria media]